MFDGKKNMDKGKVDTIIGAEAKISGTIESQGAIRIDGLLEGEIHSDANIIIGKTGKVKGQIKCNNLTVGGHMEGNADIFSTLSLIETGELVGDIIVKDLDIESGAKFKGTCKMRDEIKLLENLNSDMNISPEIEESDS